MDPPGREDLGISSAGAEDLTDSQQLLVKIIKRTTKLNFEGWYLAY